MAAILLSSQQIRENRDKNAPFPSELCLFAAFILFHRFNVNILRVVSFIQLSFTENLQYLRLGDNDLHQIPSESLRPLHRLRHLDLRSNNISFISEDAFVGYGDSITFLNLQKNE